MLVLLPCGAIGLAVFARHAHRRVSDELLLPSVYEDGVSLHSVVNSARYAAIMQNLVVAAANAQQPEDTIVTLRSHRAFEVASADIARVRSSRPAVPVWTEASPHAEYLNAMAGAIEWTDTLVAAHPLVDLVRHGRGLMAIGQLQQLLQQTSSPAAAAWLRTSLLPAMFAGTALYDDQQALAAAQRAELEAEAIRLHALRQEELRVQNEALRLAERVRLDGQLAGARALAQSTASVLLRRLDRPLARIEKLIAEILSKDDSAVCWQAPLAQLNDWLSRLQTTFTQIEGFRTLAAHSADLATLETGVTESQALFERARFEHALLSAQLVGVRLEHRRYMFKNVGAHVRSATVAVLKHFHDSGQPGSDWRRLWRTVDAKGAIWLYVDESAGKVQDRWRSFHCKISFNPSGREDVGMQLELFVPCGVGGDPTVYPQEVTEGEIRPGQRPVLIKKPFGSWTRANAMTESQMEERINSCTTKISEQTSRARSERTSRALRNLYEVIHEALTSFETVYTRSQWAPASAEGPSWKHQLDYIVRSLTTDTDRHTQSNEAENSTSVEKTVTRLKDVWDEACTEFRTLLKNETEDRVESGYQMELKARGIDFRQSEEVLRAWKARCGSLRNLLDDLVNLTDWAPSVESRLRELRAHEEDDLEGSAFVKQIRDYAIYEPDFRADGWFRVSAQDHIHGSSEYTPITDDLAESLNLQPAPPAARRSVQLRLGGEKP